MDAASEPTPADVEAPPEAGGRWARVAPVLRHLGTPLLAGFCAGILVGGVGGRLAMLLLRLTSNDSLRGIETDDGFVIGEFTTATIGFVVFMGVFGAVFGLAYGIGKRWLPPRSRPWVAGVAFAAVGGATTIDPEGIDFVLLDPLWLAVALFIALPFTYGVLLAVAVQALEARPEVLRRARTTAGVLAAPLLASPAIVLIGLMVGSRYVDDDERLSRVVDGPVVTWGARAVLAVIVVLATVTLADSVSEIL